MKTYYVYIAECKDKTLYVGYTTDLDRRIAQHNTSKLGAKYTKARRPITLIHSESFDSLSKALKRECEIKSWKRPEKLALVGVK